MIFKSIRSRLLSWLAFLLVCILTGFGVTAYKLYGIHQFNQLDEALVQRVEALSGEVRKGPGTGPPPSRHGDVESDRRFTQSVGEPPSPPVEERAGRGGPFLKNQSERLRLVRAGRRLPITVPAVLVPEIPIPASRRYTFQKIY